MAREGLMDDTGYDPESWCSGSCKKCKNRKCEEDETDEEENQDD